MAKLEQYRARVIEQLKQFIDTYNNNSYMQKVGAYEYEEDELADPLFDHRLFKPATEIQGGGVYVGEW
jgi:flagellar biosynthesis/type III secretory pathway ATPase